MNQNPKRGSGGVAGTLVGIKQDGKFWDMLEAM